MTTTVKAKVKMVQKKDNLEDGFGTAIPQREAIVALAERLIAAINLDDVDEALHIEEAICRKVSEDNITGIKSLLCSEERYCNVAAIRILSDSGRVGIEGVYEHVDQLFERGDIALSGLCLRLIQQHDYFAPQSMKRMAQFIDHPDEAVREIVRVWLLWRSSSELVEFSKIHQPFEKDTERLIALIQSFKQRSITLDQFFEKLSKLDNIAFQEFTRLRDRMPRFSRDVFSS